MSSARVLEWCGGWGALQRILRLEDGWILLLFSPSSPRFLLSGFHHSTFQFHFLRLLPGQEFWHHAPNFFFLVESIEQVNEQCQSKRGVLDVGSELPSQGVI